MMPGFGAPRKKGWTGPLPGPAERVFNYSLPGPGFAAPFSVHPLLADPVSKKASIANPT